MFKTRSSNRHRKVIASVMAFLVVLVAVVPAVINPLGVSAEAINKIHDLASGSLSITSSDTGYYNFIVRNSGAVTSNTITVGSGYEGTITLQNVEMNKTSTNCINIDSGANVTLLLEGTNKMANTGSSPYPAVLRVHENAKLTIDSYNGNDGDGTLYVKQHTSVSGAAIGSNYGEDSGTIIIDGGTVEAWGGDDSAGIGGGAGGASGGTGGGGGTITINGGIVRSVCDSRTGTDNSGAAIGSGFPCYNQKTWIRINGGDVTATTLLPRYTSGSTESTLSGAAIGAGNIPAGLRGNTNPTAGNFGYIILAGGKIKASVWGTFDNAGTHTQAYGVKANDLGLPVLGTDGVAIGGGATPFAKGTIIVLPSADVTELYGGKANITHCDYGAGYDIGNADKIFYLNKANPRVAVGVGSVASTGVKRITAKKLTARADVTAGTYKANADVYVRVYMADSYLPAVAAWVGNTGTDGILGNGSPSSDTAPNFYTNAAADFYTDAAVVDGQTDRFALDKVVDGTDILSGYDLQNRHPGETYEPDSVNPFNLIFTKDGAPSYTLQLGNPRSMLPTAADLLTGNTPSGASGWTYPAAATDFAQDDIHLHFGEWNYKSTGAVSVSSGNFPNPFTKMQALLKNAGNQPLNVTVDQSDVKSFDLSGPLISSPPVSGGQSLPANSSDNVVATKRNQVRAGERDEKLVFTVTPADGTSPYTKTLHLHIKVNQENVSPSGTGVNAGDLIANSPNPVPAKTNKTQVSVIAQANDTMMDGVKTVWIRVTNSATPPALSSPGAAYPSAADENADETVGWRRIDGDIGSDSFYTFNKTISNVKLPGTDGTYYIHWYMETENTYGSHGTLGGYEVLRNGPTPAISKTGSQVVNTSNFTVNVDFDRPVVNLREARFTVKNGTILAGSLSPATGTAQNYTMTIVPAGTGNIEIMLDADKVQDEYGNYNVASNNLILTLNDGKPAANFSTIDPIYYADQSSIQFEVTSGIANVALFNSTSSAINSTNADVIFTITKDGVSFPVLGAVTYSGNIFTVNKLFDEGVYVITIAAGNIKNDTGKPIELSTYTFRVTLPHVTPSPGTAIEITPLTMPYTAGNATITIHGTLLDKAGTTLEIELPVSLGGGRVNPTTFNAAGTEAYYTVTLPQNTSPADIVYTFEGYLRGSSFGTVSTTVERQQPGIHSLQISDDGGATYGGSVVLNDGGGTVDFKVDGQFLQLFQPIDITNDGGLTAVTMPTNGAVYNSTTYSGFIIPANKSQADKVYTFEVTGSGGSPTGFTVTVTVKKPEMGVQSITATPARHSQAGGTSKVDLTGLHMDVLTSVEVRVDELSSLNHNVTSTTGFTNNGADATFNMTFPVWNGGLRNDIYTLRVYSEGIDTGLTATVEVGDSLPNITGASINPNYYANVEATMNGKGRSVITIDGNYLENFSSIQIYDYIYDTYYTVNKTGCDQTATYTVSVPSAIGVFQYDIWADGTYAGHFVQVGVGEQAAGVLPPSGNVGDPNETRDNGGGNQPRKGEWAGGGGNGGGGSKGGSFTGRLEVGWEVVEYQATRAGKENPKNPQVTYANIALFTRQHFDMAASGAKAGAKQAETVGAGILTVRFDTSTIDNQSKLEGRMYIKLDQPVPDVFPSVYTREEYTKETKALFQNRFSNKNISVIHLDQNDAFGVAEVEIAAAVDLTGMNTTKLYIYRMDRKTGEFELLENTRYYIDTAGYLHFFTKVGGDFIVTDSPLSENGQSVTKGSFPVENMPKTLTPALQAASLGQTQQQEER